MFKSLRSNPLLRQTLRAGKWPSLRRSVLLLLTLLVGSFLARDYLVRQIPAEALGLTLLLIWLLPFISMMVAVGVTAGRIRSDGFYLVKQSPLPDHQITWGLALSTLYELRVVLALAFGLLPLLVDDQPGGGIATGLCLAGLHLATSTLGTVLVLRWGRERLGVIVVGIGSILALVVVQIINTFWAGSLMPGCPSIAISPVQLRLSVILLRLGMRTPLVAGMAAVLPALLGCSAGWLPWRGREEDRFLRLEMLGGVLAIILVLGVLVGVKIGERPALTALYQSTGGESWYNNDGWLSEQPICNWYGISCNCGWVTGVSLTRNNLQGPLPPEIGLLSNLQTLHLEGELWNPDTEHKTMTLPPEIGQLVNLSELSLSGNRIERLPAEIGNLANLQTLNLHETYLLEMPPEIGRLANLKELDLGGNELSDLPPEIGQLVSLSELSLSGNRIERFPAEIGNLTNLQTLNLNGTYLLEMPTEIGRLANLKELDLGSNELSDLPPEIGQLNRLEILRVYFNRLLELPPEIGLLSSLQRLEISSNRLLELPVEVGQLTNLQFLDVNGNLIARLPAAVCQLPNLEMGIGQREALCGSISSQKQPAVVYVDALPSNSPEMGAPLPDGTYPCGLAKLNWGDQIFKWGDYPGCQPAFPHVAVYCLDREGQWTDYAIRVINISRETQTVTVKSVRDGMCGLFPQK